MSHLSPEQLDRLEQLAYGIREVFSERGHNVGRALDHDAAFREGERARSGLVRSLMQSAVAAATSAVSGLDLATGRGGVRLVQSFDGLHLRRFRVLAASKHDETFRIPSSSETVLLVDDNSAFIEENWVLGYTVNMDNDVDDLFVAAILDVTEGNPGELVLGPEYRLVGLPPNGDEGFKPTTEDLPMDDLEEEADRDSHAG